MSRRNSRVVSIVAIVATAALSIPASAAPDSAIVARGQALVARNCARCHAVGSAGSSPDERAPPFRRLHERYAVDDLAEGLAEGLSVGHGPMPEWRFEPDAVEAIIAYLKSVQARPKSADASRERAPRP